MSAVRDFFTAIDRLPRAAVIALSVALALLIAALDAATGSEVAMTLFYLVPLCIAAWAGGRRTGALFAVGIAAIWYVAEALSVGEWTSGVAVWNGIVRFAVLYLAALVMATLREAIDEQRLLARRDERTGLANAREFAERATIELKRVARLGVPLTVAYCDVDDLKRVNDTYGHEAGDRLLAGVALALRASLRSTDMVARMGGDEFACLLPGAMGGDALAALMKVLDGVAELSDEGSGRATVSIGAVWTRMPVKSVDTLLRQADAHLYEVKASGKDGLLASAAGEAPQTGIMRREPTASRIGEA